MPDTRRIERRQRILADFGEFALRSDDLDAVLTQACRLVADALGTGRAKVLEIEHERQTLFVRAGVGWDDGVVGSLRLPMAEPSSETFSIELGEPVITNDLATEDRFDFPAFLKEAGVEALANVPVFLPGGKPFGLLQVDASEPRAFGDEDSQFLRTYATILGPVIDRLLKVQSYGAKEERHRFLLALGDALRAAPSANRKVELAAQLLGERLKASRVLWAEYDWTSDLAHISHGWFADGAQPFPTVMRLKDYAGEVLNELKAGQIVRVDDIGRFVERPGYAAIASVGVQALLSVPLIVGDALKVNISIHQHEPRQWTDDEVALVHEAAERLWAEVVRARAEAALAASEEKYRSLFDAIDEGLAIVEMIYDDRGQIVDMIFRQVNAAYERQGGIYDVVGRSIREVLPGVESIWLDRYKRVATTGEPLRVEDYQQDVSRWFEVSFARVDEKGRFVAIVFNDITERKVAEQVLRESEERQAFLLKLSDTLRAAPDDAIIERAVDMLSEKLRLDLCYVVTVSPDADRADVIHQLRRGADMPGVPAAIRLSDYPQAFVEWQNRTLVSDDMANDPALTEIDRRNVAAMRFGALIAAPVRRGVGNPIWSIVAVTAQSRRWTVSQIALVEETAERTWAAVERARAEAELRESQNRQAFLLKVSDALRPLANAEEIQATTTWLLGAHLRVDRAMYAEVTGERGAEAGAIRGQFIRPAAPGRPAPAPFPDHFTYETFGTDVMARRYTGEGLAVADVNADPGFDATERAAWARVGVQAAIVAPLVKGGRLVAELGVHSETPREWTDAEVSLVREVGERTWAAAERARAEAALAASEKRYHSLFQSMDEAYAVVEVLKDEAGDWADFRFVEVNPAFMHHSGMPHPVGRTATELLGTPNPRWAQMYGQALDTGEPLRIQESELTLGRTFDLNIFSLEPALNRVAVLFTDITQRKLAEAALRASEERFRAIAEQTEVGVAMADREGRVTWVNDRFVEIAGRSRDELTRLTIQDYTHPDEWPENERLFRRMIDDGTTFVLEKRINREGDSPRWNRVSVSPRRDSSGSITGGVAVIVDISGRIRAENTLRESEERFRLIVENARDYAIFTLDADGRIADWLPGAEKVFGWSPDEVRGQPVDITFTAEDRMAGAPAREQEIARRDGTAPNVRWHVRKDGSRVFIDGINSAIRDPDGTLRGFLKIGQDVTERRAAEQALRESEERFRQFGEASSDLIWIRNAEMMAYEYVSPAFDTIYGRPRAEVGDQLERWAATIHPDDRDRVLANVDRVRGGERVEHGFRILRPDGEVRWIDDVDFPLRDADGRITRIGGIGHDVTVAKLAADALQESEERFRSFAEASEDVLWIVDAATRQLEYVSPAYERIWGEPREAIMADLGQWAARIHPDDLPPPGGGLDALFAGRSLTLEYRVQRRDGTTRYVRDTGFPIFDGAGRVHRVAGVAQDLTDRRNAERAVIESERRARTLMEGIPQLVWRSADEGRWTWSSPQWQECTGQTQEESLGLGWLDAVHPDDREAAMRAWAAARSYGLIDVEYRVHRARDGAYLWHHTRAVPVRDEQGRIVEWLGTTTDIQQLKELQERQEIMVAELQHRTRNLIAVVRSIAQQTMAQTGPTEAFRDQLNHRLEALARVQGLLSRSDEEPITIEALIRMELDALGAKPEPGRIDVHGPAVRIRHSVVQTLALALHELATNARKYGALSSATGRLDVRWRTYSDAKSERLALEWAEVGGQAPKPECDARRGYGRDLIEKALPYSLNARTSFEHDAAGLRCTIDMPLKRTRSRRTAA